MTKHQTLTVYLGSSGHARPVFKDAAIQLGELIAQHNRKLVYGGMDAGLMGLLALAALKNGAHVTGIIPRKLKDSERILSGLSETVMVETLWERKRKLFEAADAIIALPGGFGTLDESAEALHWGKIGLHGTPLVLVNIEDYYTPLIEYFKTLPDFDPAYLIEVSAVEDIFAALDNAPPLPAPLQKPQHYPHFEDEITRGTDEPIIVDKATLENTYFLICALGLKQLDKTRRAIGLHNKGGQFDGLIAWLRAAHDEHFITAHCLDLLLVEEDHAALDEKLKTHIHEVIDLHRDKWGAPVEK